MAHSTHIFKMLAITCQSYRVYFCDPVHNERSFVFVLCFRRFCRCFRFDYETAVWIMCSRGKRNLHKTPDLAQCLKKRLIHMNSTRKFRVPTFSTGFFLSIWQSE